MRHNPAGAVLIAETQNRKDIDDNCHDGWMRPGQGVSVVLGDRQQRFAYAGLRSLEILAAKDANCATECSTTITASRALRYSRLTLLQPEHYSARCLRAATII